ncbi:MAG: hypothetical protein ABGX27_06795 [Desulfurobacteriaceae bacterium]
MKNLLFSLSLIVLSIYLLIILFQLLLRKDHLELMVPLTILLFVGITTSLEITEDVFQFPKRGESYLQSTTCEVSRVRNFLYEKRITCRNGEVLIDRLTIRSFRENEIIKVKYLPVSLIITKISRVGSSHPQESFK